MPRFNLQLRFLSSKFNVPTLFDPMLSTNILYFSLFLFGNASVTIGLVEQRIFDHTIMLLSDYCLSRSQDLLCLRFS